MEYVHYYNVPFSADIAQGLRALAQRPDREKWEVLFNETYVQPFLKVQRIFTCICVISLIINSLLQNDYVDINAVH